MGKIKEYFDVREFVSPDVWDKYGERSWKFIDSRLLDILLIIREEVGEAITINNWLYGGRFTQRGLRENTCDIVKNKTKIYLSAHVLGKAIDFDINGVTAEEGRTIITGLSHLLPYKIRLEDGVSWIHLDVIDEPQNNKVYSFKP
ncbi:MAG: hypothetical protein KAH32_04115 [Chlamydiia bacterium]|nr:hypothetical protein [Chlamydiia bacterium]